MNTFQHPTTSDVYPTPPKRDSTRPDANGHDEARFLKSEDVTTNTDKQTADKPQHELCSEIADTDQQSRSDPSIRAETRTNGSDRVDTRQDATDRDATLLEAPSVRGETSEIMDVNDTNLDTNWLDVEQAAELLKERGISRTIRTIQKMCKRGDLTARLVPTENSVRYIISDQSIDEFVDRHNKKLPSGGFGPAESDEADQTREPHRNVPFSDRTINSTVANQLDHEHAPQSAVDPISSHLREIIELKNEQIAEGTCTSRVM